MAARLLYSGHLVSRGTRIFSCCARIWTDRIFARSSSFLIFNIKSARCLYLCAVGQWQSAAHCRSGFPLALTSGFTGASPHNKRPKQYSTKLFEKENIWTVPNLLSSLRICSAPLLGWCVLGGHHSAALALFALAGLTDWMDGLVARRVPGQMSALGSVLDPLADKLLTCVLFVALARVGLLPVWLTAVVLGRDLLLVLGAFYLRYTTLPPPKTWTRYWDVQRSTLTVTPSTVSKVNTLLQMVLLGMTLAGPALSLQLEALLQPLWYLTAGTTAVSGWSYLFSRNGFKPLTRSKSQQNNS